MQSSLYPKGPIGVQPELTNPSKSFKKQIWMALGALVLFMAIYVSLSSWFLYKSYHLLSNGFSGGRDSFLSIVGGLFLGFLGIFMVKALFFRTAKDTQSTIEINKENEPELFNFINQIADEAKAPRPHKIFISNVVNASVSYDISIINLIFPTKKNLEIGLGLVNTLNLGEFKSIIAHEFGHFAQKSMLIGRWVYIAHRVAEQIVGKRDAFDTFLNGLSRVDIRIAWIGWILSIIVWSIRSISETLFTLVLYTQRALSREMEFHADLVAVSLTGSDAIVHSLHKLHAADEAYSKAMEFVNKQLGNKKTVSDIFTIQSNSIKQMAIVLNNPTYGASPKIETPNHTEFRVFKEQIVQTPQMWSTHPSNIDREKNAKATYIKSEIDERSPWLLFNNPAQIRNKTTLRLYEHLTIETTELSIEESITLHDNEFQCRFLQPMYKGIYLDRPIFLHEQDIMNVYNLVSENDEQLNRQFTQLYPDSLQQQLAILKNLEEEKDTLESLNKTNQQKINHRNKEISKNDLPEAISQVKLEINTERKPIDVHNLLCRHTHYSAAKKIGKGWDTYLLSVATLIHYCEHSKKNIEVYTQYFGESLVVASQIKSFGSSDLSPLLFAANRLHYHLEAVYNKGAEIQLSQSIIDKMGGKTLKEYLEPFTLGFANDGNINSWIKVIGGWVELAIKGLTIVHEAALDELLLTEDYIKKSYTTPYQDIKEAPAPIIIDNSYKKFNSDENLTVTQKPDLFSKFYNGDGTPYTIGRAAVAASIIFFAVFLSLGIGNTRVTVYNGLPVDVYVNFDDKKILVPHEESYQIEIDNASFVDIETSTLTGESIESFKAEMTSGSNDYVYNVAYAAAIYTSTVHYGNLYFNTPSNDFSIIGNPRWVQLKADYYFEEPPTSISVKQGHSESRKVVAAYLGHPSEISSILSLSENKEKLFNAHATYQAKDSPYILSWLALASTSTEFPEILAYRLAKDPYEVVSLRIEQDVAIGNEKKKICEKQTKLYQANSSNADLYYLSCRCIENIATRDSSFVNGYNRWKDNTWLAFAAGYTFTQREEWNKAINCFSVVNEQAPQLKDAVEEELKRIYHFTKQDSLMNSGNIAQSPYLRYVQNVEESVENTDPNNEDYVYAYKLLEQGNIEAAVEYCKPDSNLYFTILRLAAVSDGSNKNLVEKALALNPSQGFNNTNFPCALALQVKNNLPYETYREELKTSIGDADTVFKFIKLLKANKMEEADNILKSLSAEMKGKLSLLGSLILENKTPPKWNSYASGLLFITEKPYRKSTLNKPVL